MAVKLSHITFSELELKLLLAGQKTQHRILIKKPFSKNARWFPNYIIDGKTFLIPQLKIGQHLYVCERWATDKAGNYIYKADGESKSEKWKASNIMPKAAGRIFLKVTDIWGEPLSEISRESVKKEGFKSKENFAKAWDDKVRETATELWRMKRVPTYGFDFGAWVWVIEFERII